MSKNKTLQRSLYSFIILVILIPTFAINSFANMPGRIIGSIIFISIGFIGLYEIYVSIGIKKNIALIASMVVPVFFALDNNTITFFMNYGTEDKTLPVAMRVGLFNWQQWISIFAFLIIPMLDDSFRKSKNFTSNILFMIVLSITISVFTKGAWIINIFKFEYIFFFVPIAIISDTFAYFGGMLFGKKLFKGAKFAPNISPKKTWAGFLFGLIGSLLFTIIAGYYMNIWSDFGQWNLLVSIVFGILLSVISPYGDLLFSAVKRINKTKDFSNLIPGHGGIFDRLDALSVIITTSSFLLMFGLIQ